MREKKSTNLLIATSIIIAIATIIAFINYYFIKPIVIANEKREVLESERIDLERLTMAYLNQNVDLSLKDSLFNEAISRKYAVTAEYYYLKNGLGHLNEYDKILNLSKLLFNDKSINASNFSINVDEEKCGKEKYSTIEGQIFNENCDQKAVVYEIISTYYQNYEYVVEFYASKAIQNTVESKETCESFEIPFGYKIQLIDLENKAFYDKSDFKCCLESCSLEGIKPFEDELKNQIKAHNNIYKMTFEKVDDHFVFSKINKV